MDFVMIYVTCKDADEAGRIASLLVERRQAACANVIPGVTSFFRWNGVMERSQEVLLLIKTRGELFDSVRESVKKVHSYATPEIVAVPFVSGDVEYLGWIKEETEQNGL